MEFNQNDKERSELKTCKHCWDYYEYDEGVFDGTSFKCFECLEELMQEDRRYECRDEEHFKL